MAPSPGPLPAELARGNGRGHHECELVEELGVGPREVEPNRAGLAIDGDPTVEVAGARTAVLRANDPRVLAREVWVSRAHRALDPVADVLRLHESAVRVADPVAQPERV